MSFTIEQGREILARTPRVLSALLDGLSDQWVEVDEGPETWSPFDVLGHLIHGERTDWLVRARTILEQGEAQPFEPFDRWAMLEASRGKSTGDLLAEFARLRQENLEQLDALEIAVDDLDKTGIHPEFGKVSLGQLLATWVAHDLGHLAQVARVMAKRYADEVGPWKEYLPILQ